MEQAFAIRTSFSGHESKMSKICKWQSYAELISVAVWICGNGM